MNKELYSMNAPAKVNLALDILGRREDGYHDMRMINHSCSLADTLTLTPAKDYSLVCNQSAIKTDGSNLITQVVQYLSEYTGNAPEFSMTLEKNIPQMAGLAGGSADAAAAAVLADRYWGTSLGTEKLAELLLPYGADIPYCLYNTPALVEGIGERITPIQTSLQASLLLIKPAVEIPTPLAFSWTDEEQALYHPKIDEAIGLLERSDYNGLMKTGGNSFSEPVIQRYPVVGQILRWLERSGAFYSVMSGSGSTVAGYFYDSKDRDKAAVLFQEHTIIRTEINNELR